MLTHATPYENSLPTLRVLQQYVRETEHGPDQISAQQAYLREQAISGVVQQLGANSVFNFIPLLTRASRFRLLLKWTHASIRLRERARFKQALLYTRLRHIALQLGARLQTQGILLQKEEVFFLTVDEVLALASGSHLLAQSIPTTINARRLAFETYVKSDVVAPDSFCLPVGEQWHANTHNARNSVNSESVRVCLVLVPVVDTFKAPLALCWM
jgi:pyruvate,water dikinase